MTIVPINPNIIVILIEICIKILVNALKLVNKKIIIYINSKKYIIFGCYKEKNKIIKHMESCSRLFTLKNIVVLFIVFILSSCASLTKTQIASVNQFSSISRNFSAYPSKIISEISELKISRSLYYVNTLDNASDRLRELDSIYVTKSRDEIVSEKIDITFKIIDKYAQSLMLLSSEKHSKDLEIQSRNFGGGIDSLINAYNAISKGNKLQSGIGAALGKIVSFAGKQYIQYRQAKEIKKFVTTADTLVQIMTNNLLEFLNNTNIENQIVRNERRLKTDYLNYLNQKIKTGDINIESDMDYLQMLGKINNIRKLQKQCIDATIALKKAHYELLTCLIRKKKLKDRIETLTILYEDVRELNETMNELDKK